MLLVGGEEGFAVSDGAHNGVFIPGGVRHINMIKLANGDEATVVINNDHAVQVYKLANQSFN